MSSGRVHKPRKSRRAPGATNSSTGMRRGSRRDSRDSVGALFDNFKDAHQDKIGPESLEAFFDALDLDPLDVSALIFAWKLGASTPCEFSRAEFVDGLVRLGVDSLAKLKKKVHGLKAMIAEPDDFRSFYLYAFEYNKPPGQRSMPVETARQLWPLLLKDRFTHMDLWLEFLATRKGVITKDSFVLTLDFVNTILPDFSNFEEENGAWPVLLDEFVDFAKSRLPPPHVASRSGDDDERSDMSD